MADEKAATGTGFVERALGWFAHRGVIAKRLMTDNAFGYVRNRSLRELLQAHDIKHLTTQPYRPRTNGKAERFHQTPRIGLRRGLPLTPPPQPALPHWLRHSNERRPHSSTGGRPPTSRVHNLGGHDS